MVTAEVFAFTTNVDTHVAASTPRPIRPAVAVGGVVIRGLSDLRREAGLIRREWSCDGADAGAGATGRLHLRGMTPGAAGRRDHRRQWSGWRSNRMSQLPVPTRPEQEARGDAADLVTRLADPVPRLVAVGMLVGAAPARRPAAADR
jgi:hypothetical protein